MYKQQKNKANCTYFLIDQVKVITLVRCLLLSVSVTGDSPSLFVLLTIVIGFESLENRQILSGHWNESIMGISSNY